MTRTTSLLGALAAATLLFAACGDDDTTSTPSDGGASTSDGNGATVDISDFTYLPDSITVAAGTEITFVNADGTPHTATAKDGSFNTESIGGNDEGTVTVTEPGEHQYFCAFHPFMEATVIVE